jgi:hypothetical protein
MNNAFASGGTVPDTHRKGDWVHATLWVEDDKIQYPTVNRIPVVQLRAVLYHSCIKTMPQI